MDPDLPDLLSDLVDTLKEPWGSVALGDVADMAISVFEYDDEDAMDPEDYTEYEATVWKVINLLKEIARV